MIFVTVLAVVESVGGWFFLSELLARGMSLLSLHSSVFPRMIACGDEVWRRVGVSVPRPWLRSWRWGVEANSGA